MVRIKAAAAKSRCSLIQPYPAYCQPLSCVGISNYATLKWVGSANRYYWGLFISIVLVFSQIRALTWQAVSLPVLMQQKQLGLEGGRDHCLFISNPVLDHIKLWNHTLKPLFCCYSGHFFFPFIDRAIKHVRTSAFLMQSPS